MSYRRYIFRRSARVVAGLLIAFTLVAAHSAIARSTDRWAALDDPTLPAITTQPTDQTVNVGESLTLSVTATGDPPLAYQWRKAGVDLPGATNSSYTVFSVSVADAGSYDVVVSNNAGSVTSATAIVVVNRPPVAQSQTARGSEDSDVLVTLAGSDADGDALSYRITTLPIKGKLYQFDADGTRGSQISVVPTTVDDPQHRIVFVPASNGNGAPYTSFAFATSDSRANSAAATITINIAPVNDPPTISGTPAASIDEDSAYSFTPSASDPDGDPLTFSIANQPAWATFTTTTGRLSGTPANADVGTTTGIVISVSDGTTSATLPPFNLVVSNTNDPPVFTSTPVTNATKGRVYTYVVSMIDPDVGDTVSFAAPSHPVWLGLYPEDDGTGTLTGTPGADDVGSNKVTIRITDGKTTVSQTFTITVDTSNAAPTIASIPNQTTAQATPLGPIAFSVGDPDNDPSTLSITANTSDPELVSVAGVVLAGTGTQRTATITPVPNRTGSVTITLTVSDGSKTASTSFVLTIKQAERKIFLPFVLQ